MIEIPNVFNGTVTWQNYQTITNRINQFDGVETIGKDASGTYDMFAVRMGNSQKPTILFTASVHGVEWQTTQVLLDFMEMLRDDNHPDNVFRNTFLNDYELIFLPVLNPWGLDNNPDPKARTNQTYYRNSNSVDLNRDFLNQTQQETKNVVQIMERYTPFAHMDMHMFQPGFDPNQLIVGVEIEEGQSYQNKIVDSLENFTNRVVSNWGIQPEREHMVRGFTTFQENPYTDFTFSILSEIERPDGQGTPSVSDSQIYSYYHAFIYSFLQTADLFYKDQNKEMNVADEFVHQIETPTKNIVIERTNQGLAQKITEHFKNGKIIDTLFSRNSNGTVQHIDRNERE